MATLKKIPFNYCQYCKSKEEFKEIVALERSGLLIYVYNDKTPIKRSGEMYNRIILYNTSNRDLSRVEYIAEFCQYRTNCNRCKMIIQNAKRLLDNFSIIKKNDVLSICEHCNFFKNTNKCKRCEYIANKFINYKLKYNEKQQEVTKTYLCKIQQLLASILEEELVCPHWLHEDSNSKTKLLNFLKSSVPDIEVKAFLNSDKSQIQKDSNYNTFWGSKISLLNFLKSSTSNIKDFYVEALQEDTNLKTEHNAFSELTAIDKSRSLDLHLNTEETTHDSSAITKKLSACICKIFKTKNKANAYISLQALENDLTRVNSPTTHGTTSQSHTTFNKLDNKRKDLQVSSKTHSKYKVDNTNKKGINLSKKVSKLTNSGTELSMTEQDAKADKLKGRDEKGKVIKEHDKITEKIAPFKNSTTYDIVSSGKGPDDLEPMITMIKYREKGKRIGGKNNKRAQNINLSPFGDLPTSKSEKNDKVSPKGSESIVECQSHGSTNGIEMIRGNQIIPLHPNYKELLSEKFVQPLLFKRIDDFVLPEIIKKIDKATNTSTSISSNRKGTERRTKSERDYAGVLRYRLSNRVFIDKGWTKLPTIKVMRRVNIYKMQPSCSNWFENHKDVKVHYYDTGEKLAEIQTDGSGKLYYKNGNVALDYYDAKEVNIERRYIVYSSGDLDEHGRPKEITILACFDKLGNGVVYDHSGNYSGNIDAIAAGVGNAVIPKHGRNVAELYHLVLTMVVTHMAYQSFTFYELPTEMTDDLFYKEELARRRSLLELSNVCVLKFNQSEGIIIDPKIGPPCRWKWHTLNDPPVLQNVFINTFVSGPPVISSSPVPVDRNENDKMFAIELENFVKAQNKKMIQKLVPCKVKMKALKINNYFSLRIIEQENIYLLFRCGALSLKLNIGMLLISNEIIDTEVADVSEVWTPYDKKINRTESLTAINTIINKSRKVKS